MQRPVRANHRMISPDVDMLATSGLRLLNSQSPWYCGRVAPGRERAFERGLHRFEIPTYFPVHSREIKRRHYNWRTKDNDIRTYPREMPLFPGYVFVALDDGVWSLIRERVAYKPRWLTCDGVPAQFPIELLARLQAEEQNGFVQIATEPEYQEGDEMEITGPGIWYGRRGILASDPARRVLTLHMIAESYSLEPTLVVSRVQFERRDVRLASH